ncbi:helix-turn-helix transcriptional regulator [Spirochaeta cellobiosiphila]|uniref:helix-turn-helix transcriptional regulator n=1 Tax=Spirochaeta cellobiosiphila TaxID=504483 RepID=UPI000426C099|nr:LuxR C-terminal-related transcriptional regulator [Spirochaeta cellobiosiphila]
MQFGYSFFWFITYSILVAGTAISAGAIHYDKRFSLITAMNLSLILIAVSVFFILFFYYQGDISVEGWGYFLLVFLFFLGLATSSYFILPIPDTLLSQDTEQNKWLLAIKTIIALGFLGYTITAFLDKLFFYNEGNSILNGIFQLLVFFCFLASSIYSYVRFMRGKLIQSPLYKVFITLLGILGISSIFIIDVFYGLWSKIHTQNELSIFYLLPAYSILLSSLLTIHILKTLRQNRTKNLTGYKDILSESGISPREEEIIQLLIKGNSYKDIAETLFISLATVQTHVRSIYKKMGVRNKVELINSLQIP